MSGRNAHTPAVFLGAVYAGCCYAPMDGTMPVHRLNSILNTLDTDLMIVQRAFYDKAKTLDFSGTILIAEELLAGSEDAALLADCRARARELDPLYIIFTSGSTGTPKGIVISHRAILDFTDWLTDFCGYTEYEIFGNQAPFYFDLSGKDVYQTLSLGASCRIFEKKYFTFPMLLLKAMEETGVKPKVEPIRGGTDGAQLSYRGLPCPNIFAGGVNFHGPYEFVSIQVMEKAMQVVIKISELAAGYND